MEGEGTVIAASGCTSHTSLSIKTPEVRHYIVSCFLFKTHSFADVTSTKSPWINIAATGRLWSMMKTEKRYFIKTSFFLLCSKYFGMFVF